MLTEAEIKAYTMDIPNDIQAARCASGCASVSGSAAGPNSHKCTTCGHVWESTDDKTTSDVRKAVQVNGQGPSCGLCMHLEMAYRYAETQGYRTFTDAVTQWLNISKPQKDQALPHGGAERTSNANRD